MAGQTIVRGKCVRSRGDRGCILGCGVKFGDGMRVFAFFSRGACVTYMYIFFILQDMSPILLPHPKMLHPKMEHRGIDLRTHLRRTQKGASYASKVAARNLSFSSDCLIREYEDKSLFGSFKVAW